MVLKKTPETAWTRLNQSLLKETNPEYSIGNTDTKAEAPILFSPDEKSNLFGKDPDIQKD